MEREGDGDTNRKWSTWNSLQKQRKEAAETEDHRKNRNHLFQLIISMQFHELEEAY